MSLSLSSLLNPSPDADGTDQSTNDAPRKDSLPPISYVQSPEQTHAPSLPAARQGYSNPPATEQDAIQGLATLVGSPSAPNASEWYGGQQSYDRRSSSHDNRPGSSGMQLPMPSSDGRKMSSPTLEHYHVPSRSPEQGRVPSNQGMTLPPLQKVISEDQTAPSSAHERPDSLHHNSREGEHIPSPSRDAHNEASSSQSHSKAQLPPQLQEQSIATSEEMQSSPAIVKQEAAATPPITSPTDARRSSMQEIDGQTNKAVATLKSEHSALTQSPLRESSVPVQSTETAPEVTNPKKRAAPTKKKGTATVTNKKAPPAKKRKVEPKRSATPSSVASKTPASKLLSGKGTPANSSPAPSTRSQSAEPNDEPEDDEEEMDEGDIDDDELYCLCRKRDTGTFMIGCDGTCDDWFHGKCVGIEERDKNLIDKYICPTCEKKGIGKTTWKRICRRPGCRMPAKIGKSKSGKDGSKYCSEECGVRYFREMVSKSRGRDDGAKNRASRRKSSIISHERPSMDDDLGARGGALAAGELKALVTSSKTAEDFKKLGEGVLSPPATPDSKKAPAPQDDILTDADAAAIAKIGREKDTAREKHKLLKDRMKFVTMVKQAASRTATERELKPKEYCGYDSRLEWTDVQFDRWRHSKGGKQAFELETLATSDGDSDDPVKNEDGEFEHEVCERKKCARHLEWNKLAIDDVRAYMSDNGDRMRELDREERGIRERAVLRKKAGAGGGEGSVEVHDLPAVGVGIVGKEGGGSERDGGVGMEMEMERPIEQPAVVESVEGREGDAEMEGA